MPGGQIDRAHRIGRIRPHGDHRADARLARPAQYRVNLVNQLR